MKAKHRFERLVNTLSDVLQKQTDDLAYALSDGGQPPPFSRRLTEDEQVEMYLAMDGEKWGTMLKERGAAEVLEYSQAMLSLINKKYGPIHPSAAWVEYTPQDYMTTMAQMMGTPGGGGVLPGMGGPPGMGQSGMPPPGMAPPGMAPPQLPGQPVPMG